MALRKYLVAGLLSAAFLATGFTETFPPFVGSSENSEAVSNPGAEMRRVLRVIDGDTIVLSPNEKVRLIGVDAPETAHPRKVVECFGKNAKEFTRAAVEGKNPFALFLMKQHATNQDSMGVLLAICTLRGHPFECGAYPAGYAHAYTRFPFRYIVEFRQMEPLVAAKPSAFGRVVPQVVILARENENVVFLRTTAVLSRRTCS